MTALMSNQTAALPALASCPFCGSVTRIHSYSKHIGKATPTLFQTAQVKCKKQSCGMSGPLVKGDDCRRRAAARFNAAIRPRLDQQAEIERLRWWLSEINMRGKQYGPEELADLAVDGLAGKPAEGVQA